MEAKMVGVIGNQQGYVTGYNMRNQNIQNAGQYAGNRMGQFVGNQRGQNVGIQAMGNQNRNVAAPVVGNQKAAHHNRHKE